MNCSNSEVFFLFFNLLYSLQVSYRRWLTLTIYFISRYGDSFLYYVFDRIKNKCSSLHKIEINSYLVWQMTISIWHIPHRYSVNHHPSLDNVIVLRVSWKTTIILNSQSKYRIKLSFTNSCFFFYQRSTRWFLNR